VRASNGNLSIAVRDDGVGFETTQERQFVGLGHASMRERVRLLGGILKIRSAPGQGTIVETQIPLDVTAI
jgi:signal transduction histidine kinase